VIIYPKGVQHNLIFISRSYTLFSMIFRLSRYFLRILLNRKENKKRNPALGQGSSPRPQCRRVTWAGGLLWQLGATMGWPIGRPGPAVAVAQGARARCAQARRGTITTAKASMVARAATAQRWLPLLQGRGHGHEGNGRGASDKMDNDAAHRGGRASVRWRGETGAAAF
jgi:hypothetical protein